MGPIKFSSFIALVSTMYSVAGWLGAIISAALLLAGIWWVER